MSNLILKENPRRFTNQEYIEVLEFLLELKSTIEKVLSVHKGETEIPVLEGLTLEETMALEYVDNLESIDWAEYDRIYKGVVTNIYFPGTGAIELFMASLEEIKYVLIHMQTQINCMQPYNFDRMYKEDLEIQGANLNYCILCSFQMFDVRHGHITVAFNEYCKGRNFNPESFVDKLYKQYQKNRPSLPLFEKYPELAIALEKSISSEYFEAVVQDSNYLEFKELNDIASGKLEVDDNFLEELNNRREGATAIEIS